MTLTIIKRNRVYFIKFFYRLNKTSCGVLPPLKTTTAFFILLLYAMFKYLWVWTERRQFRSIQVSIHSFVALGFWLIGWRAIVVFSDTLALAISSSSWSMSFAFQPGALFRRLVPMRTWEQVAFLSSQFLEKPLPKLNPLLLLQKFRWFQFDIGNQFSRKLLLSSPSRIRTVRPRYHDILSAKSV